MTEKQITTNKSKNPNQLPSAVSILKSPPPRDLGKKGVIRALVSVGNKKPNMAPPAEAAGERVLKNEVEK